ncbi:hypothetical protein FRC02_010319 [Tulasnella sp. 418]|nr:hypothetical protein FRC02_010319 [Tulasnella sp. 418]
MQKGSRDNPSILACLYSFQHSEADVSLAIGELFINDDDTFTKRYQALQQLKAVHGVIKGSSLKAPNNQARVISDINNQWIIRKAYTSFYNTVGFKEVLTKDKKAKDEFGTAASKDIAQLIKDLYDHHSIVWNVRLEGRTVNLGDFKFYPDYPESLGRYKPIVANPSAWAELNRAKTEEESGQIVSASAPLP